MAKKKDEEKRTVFRRIRGRIVPIVVGSGAIGAGVAARKKNLELADQIRKKDPIGPFSKNNRLREMEMRGSIGGFRPQNQLQRKLDRIAKRHQGLLKGTPLSARQRRHGDPRGFMAVSKKGRNPLEISITSRQSPTIFHELGHLKQLRKGSFLLKKQLDFMDNQPKSKVGKEVAKLVEIASETQANIFGMGLTRSKKIKRELGVRVVRQLAFNESPALIKAGGAGLIAAGSAAILFGALRKDKK